MAHGLMGLEAGGACQVGVADTLANHCQVRAVMRYRHGLYGSALFSLITP